ncbi:hypothetical protein WISP_36672 [Willisornis vidua]|uniref:Uncharacterized protein n=1 Tax=Willisornis vidua TaxID=1566151 RepID=A0ABQ9DMV2_9PASS|nr:hypothetical protein WISP_36672 [Willisornis vidua]
MAHTVQRKSRRGARIYVKTELGQKETEKPSASVSLPKGCIQGPFQIWITVPLFTRCRAQGRENAGKNCTDSTERISLEYIGADKGLASPLCPTSQEKGGLAESTIVMWDSQKRVVSWLIFFHCNAGSNGSACILPSRAKPVPWLCSVLAVHSRLLSPLAMPGAVQDHKIGVGVYSQGRDRSVNNLLPMAKTTPLLWMA